MATQTAKQIIQEYLEKRAATDPQFAASYAKPKKNIDECFNYILGEARGRGSSVCMTDEEVFGLAVHYYDEDDIKIKRVSSAKVTTSKESTPKESAPKAKLTDKEKAAAKEEAVRMYQQQCLAEMARKGKETKKKQRPASVQMPSLFDELGL